MCTNWSDCFISDGVDTVREPWTERQLSLARAFILNKVALKVQYGIQSMCKQTCKQLVRTTLYI